MNTKTKNGNDNKKADTDKKVNSQKNDYKLTWLQDKTFELELTVPKSEISKAYKEVLAEFAKNTELPGFRKGMAPAKLVEDKVGKNKIYKHIIDHVVPLHYSNAVRQYGLKPIVNPKIIDLKMPEEADWLIKLSSCEAPQIKLADYKKEVAAINAKDKIWVPGKDATEKNKPDRGQKLTAIVKKLQESIEVKLPQMLLDSERDRMLSRLLAEINKLGITLDQYVQANGKTVESLKKEYENVARRNLQTEFILQEIAMTEKIQVSEEEKTAYLSQIKDEESKKQLSTPEQQAYLGLSLVRQKTIDFLLSI